MNNCPKHDPRFIGISDEKLRHCLGVARKAYEIAQMYGHDDDFCMRMFMLGFVHDVGYEFCKLPEDHATMSASMMLMLNDDYAASDIRQKSFLAIKEHGDPNGTQSDEWRILNTADLIIDYAGREVPVMERLNDIKNRYGEHSLQYQNACETAYKVGLVNIPVKIM